MKRFLMAFVLLDNLLVNTTKKLFPAAYKLGGKCKQCGVCCQEIYLKMTPAQMKSDLFRSLAIRWISWLFDFILIRVEREHNYLVFTCKHRSPEGPCRNYFWRPNVCRNYPLVDYFEKPKLLPGCGFTAAPR